MEKNGPGINIIKQVGNDTYTLGLLLDTNEQRIVVTDYRKFLNNNINNKVKFSIQKDSSGSEYVRVDTDQDIFDGISKKDYSKVARMYMQDYLMGKTLLGNNDKVNINSVSVRKYTYPKQNNNDFVLEKMQLTPELRNVLKIAKKV